MQESKGLFHIPWEASQFTCQSPLQALPLGTVPADPE